MRVFRWLGRLTLIAGPVFVLLVAVLVAFLMWVLVTAPGTRWALTTAVEAMDGQIRGVQGSIWNGVTVQDVSLAFPGLALRLEETELRVQWRRLTERHLHIEALSAGTAWVDTHPTGESPDASDSGEAFSMPALPVTVQVDRIALGELIVTQDGKPLPMTVKDFETALALGREKAQLWLRGLSLATDSVEAGLEGEVDLHALQHPWPATVFLDAKVNGLRPGAPVCFRQMLPSLPVAKQQQESFLEWLAGVAASQCPAMFGARAEGSLEAVSLTLHGDGQGMALDAAARLAPLAAMPLRSATVDLSLPDGSSLKAQAGIDHDAVQEGTEAGWATLTGTLEAKSLDVGQLSGGLIPPAVLGFDSRFSLKLDASQAVRDLDLDLAFHEGSRWNELALAGRLAVAARLPDSDVAAQAPQSDVSTQPLTPAQPASVMPPEIAQIALRRLDTNLTLGSNRVRTEGGIGATDSRLELDVHAPRLADFWPELPGGVNAQGHLGGGLAAHTVAVQGSYFPGDPASTELGTAPVALQLQAEGGWGGEPEGWRGRVASLKVDHAHLGITLGAPLELGYFPGAQAPAWQWTVGATELAFRVHGQVMVNVLHTQSRGGPGRWETAGRVARMVVSPAALQQIGADFDIAALKKDERGGVKVRGARSADDWEMVFGMDWSLGFAGAPQGSIRLRRLSGDIMVPVEMPFPMDLQDLQLNLELVPSGEARSRLDADLLLSTRRMGNLRARAGTLVHATPAGGLYLEPSDAKRVSVEAAIADLGWANLFVGDTLEIGGALQANVQFDSRPDGSWVSSGTIRGERLRMVMIDQGVRLLDGTLQARLDGERLLLERLEFPARLRAEPKEWRTAEWINTNPDAKGGNLVVSGNWNLFESRGVIDIALRRFPVVQRADRYAMMTGSLRVDAALPDVDISGKLTADAGWFDLDMLGGIPTLDSDVVVVRPGEKKEPSVPVGVTLDLEVDLGPRFYITGYGLNSGLVGSMRVQMRDGKLTGIGALRTRGGAIEAYGQRLQLRRGAITFQGDISRPVLDIEALRTGLAVEAGVRVSGTARNPRIELVSYPAVSEIEKLSWLLLGHGPNDSGGDMALLFSVGSSFLSDGEPFYRRFGIDEVSLRTGELVSVASILPVESVVSGLDQGTSDIERRFVSMSKKLSSGIMISIRQALSDTGTVAQASYRLARGLTAEASVGTINGLALVYRWFSRERPPEGRN